MRQLSLIVVSVLALSRLLQSQAGDRPAYRDAARPLEDRVHDLVGRMTLEEKFWQLYMLPGDLDDPTHDYSHGVFGLQVSPFPRGTDSTGRDAATVARAHAERINAIQRYAVEKTRLGIPIIPFDEAVHGLARDGATMFPQAIALAATWDVDLMTRVASAIAGETRSRGIRQVLSPVVNIADDVRWGRVEETYGEDPFLASEMASAFVEAFEQSGVVTTPKHFVANVGEGGRDSYPIDHSERLLEERYFPPFLAALRHGARSIMTAYNSVDGVPATQNRHLLTDILRRQWDFQGFVISDASATGGATVLHLTEPNTAAAAKHAIESGLDVIFQSSYDQHIPYWNAFRGKLIAPEAIDAAVTRVLRVKFALGLFEEPYADAGAAARVNGSADHRALAREAARRALVLLKNDRQTLPLSRTIQRIAVIGSDATEARLGGYSGPGVARVSILDGIKAALGSRGEVAYVPGPGRLSPELVTVPSKYFSSLAEGRQTPGLRGEYFANNRLDGKPAIARTDPQIDFRWTLNSPGRGIPFDWYSARWTGTLTVPLEGATRLGVEGNDGYRVYLDGTLLIDNWKKESFRTRAAEVTLLPGSQHDLRVEFFESTGNARLRLVWNSGVSDDWGAKISEAAALVGRSDVAIIVVGVEEGEFRDRAFLSLPGHQEELIQQVAATGKPVIVIVVGGSAVTMSRWIDRVGAVIDAWYPGEQGGHAVADVLFGDHNPAGRLPITFPVAEGQLPLSYNHKPTGRGDDYVDLTGQPLFPFGFGLSYTTFEYSDLRIVPDAIGVDGRVRVTCTVKNTGSRAGDEVVQLYLRDVLASVARPVMELKGFRRVSLKPGESQTVTFEIGPDALRLLDAALHWTVEPGVFRLMIGSSSKDIRLRGEVTVR